ncbi:MAG: hypothetical protein JO163_02485 [Methylobacteriaceae bacterium]|nr:hypothetical protein [Methylobacteriaceae bacterium]
MHRISRFILFAAGLGVALGAVAAVAQEQPAAMPTRISGTIEKFDGQMLVVAALTGQEVSVTLLPNCRVTALVNKTLADIKPGDFVGSAAVKGADGKLHAQEVHIFPEAMRGTGEGHRPMSEPQQTMTNGTIAEVVSAPQGRTLKLKYKDGEQEIDVAPEVRVIGIIPGDRSLLKAGAAVTIFAAKDASGAFTARFIQAEKDGVKPLM